MSTQPLDRLELGWMLALTGIVIAALTGAAYFVIGALVATAELM